ncbi:MAG: protein kinase domain-containing protein [Solirubrobacterales bacterium]
MSADAIPGLSSPIGSTLSGRYHLESKLGSGGMSTVYLAQDQTLERSVAVKVMHAGISDQPDQIERFRREARSVAQLSHPNVVAVIDAGEDGGHPYIVFEYVEGETLKQRIDRMRRLPVDEAAAYGIEIGRGLAAAHARMLVHRDVKPQNVLIDAEGRAKVTDFGIALSLESDGLTKTGRVLGTTDYVSPEQAMGQDVDARSDIYSLGILLYEMLTGHPPFQAETLVGVAMKHVNEPMPDIQQARPQVSAVLSGVIERATAKEPKQRYADMAAMLADLEGALDVEVSRAGGATGEATTVIESVPDKRRLLPARKVSVAGILLVLGAAAIALAIAALSGGGDPKRKPAEPGAPPSGAAIEISSAEDFDPEGGDGEHAEEVGLAIDGNPDTSWTTETYDAGPGLDLSAKSGVGIILGTGEPTAARTMEISSAVEGWSGEVYAASGGPPEEIAGWGSPIASIDGAATDESVTLDVPGDSSFYLLWITDLAEGEDGFVVEIGEIGLAG